MFSSKKKNVELNLMFISQASNIGNSEIIWRYVQMSG